MTVTNQAEQTVAESTMRAAEEARDEMLAAVVEFPDTFEEYLKQEPQKRAGLFDLLLRNGIGSHEATPGVIGGDNVVRVNVDKRLPYGTALVTSYVAKRRVSTSTERILLWVVVDNDFFGGATRQQNLLGKLVEDEDENGEKKYYFEPPITYGEKIDFESDKAREAMQAIDVLCEQLFYGRLQPVRALIGQVATENG